ncbi:MerR family transcriptional regulator [Streptomyces sp. NPDC020766]|uniref:MerR family transcriptional regulator n=1 Tax=Streptomyces sp. NPDC020766 TaxID=3155011 RepID=UPI00340023B1
MRGTARQATDGPQPQNYRSPPAGTPWARAATTTTTGISYYEEQGLITPERCENGYRSYGERLVDRVQQIRGLLDAGLPRPHDPAHRLPGPRPDGVRRPFPGPAGPPRARNRGARDRDRAAGCRPRAPRRRPARTAHRGGPGGTWSAATAGRSRVRWGVR